LYSALARGMPAPWTLRAPGRPVCSIITRRLRLSPDL
jgi:hypothetical protein